MRHPILANQVKQIILEAQKQDKDGLKALRKRILRAVDTFGAKRFVTVTAEVLKNNFRIEGCNDVRIPLKKIFNITLGELEVVLDKKQYNLDKAHPITMLCQDHKDNIGKLKALNLALENLDNKIFDKVKSYYAELDVHIRKEEEIFFPMLEESGMKEHPDNLRREHETFRKLMSKAIEDFDKSFIDTRASSETSSKMRDIFVPDICNHIFRETYIFYPAALEFITEEEKWQKIREEFSRI